MVALGDDVPYRQPLHEAAQVYMTGIDTTHSYSNTYMYQVLLLVGCQLSDT